MTLVRIAASLIAVMAATACEPASRENTPAPGPAIEAPNLDGGPRPEPEQASDLAGAPIDLVPSASPSSSPCALFSATEIGAFIGGAVAEGRQQDEACLWASAGADGFVRVQIAPAARHAPPDGQPGYETVASIAGDAYVVPIPDGYAGGAIDGEDAVMISISGVLNGREIAMELLRQSVERND